MKSVTFAKALTSQIKILEAQKTEEELLEQQQHAQACDDAISTVKQELAHLLDESWAVYCEDPANPYALTTFDYDGGKFSLKLIRCSAANKRYQAQLECIYKPGYIIGGPIDSNWIDVDELNLDYLSRFCFPHMKHLALNDSGDY